MADSLRDLYNKLTGSLPESPKTTELNSPKKSFSERAKDFRDRAEKFRDSAREIQNLKKKYKNIDNIIDNIICSHCLKTVKLDELVVICPHCSKEHFAETNKKYNQIANKAKQEVVKEEEKIFIDILDSFLRPKFKKDMRKILYDECDSCHRKIRHIKCYNCNEDIDLFAPYDLEELERRVYGT
jgi:hypothetical protein